MYSVYGSLAHFKAQSTCAQEPSHGHSYIGHKSLLHRHRNPSHIWTACVHMHYFTTALGHVQQSLNQRIELPSVMHWLRRPASRAQPPQYASKHTRHACFRLSRVTGRSGTKATSAELLAQPRAKQCHRILRSCFIPTALNNPTRQRPHMRCESVCHLRVRRLG